jgi:uncharacterized SAM-binding protein YcdF (DUF218 family)
VSPPEKKGKRAKTLLRDVCKGGIWISILCGLIWFVAPLGLPLMFSNPSHECISSHAIVMFYGGENVHTVDRLRKGLEPLNSCEKAKAFVIGGARPLRGFYGSDTMAIFLRDHGVSDARITQGRLSDDTLSNVNELITLTHMHQITHLTLVSDALHLMRIRWLLARATPALPSTVVLSYAHTSPFVHPWQVLTRPLYEMGAWGLMLMPLSIQRTILNWMRV